MNNMSLTELSYYVRRAMPFVVLFGLVFFIIFYSIKLYFIYVESQRSNITYTKITFGKIEPPSLDEATSSAGFDFTLDTIEGVPVTATSAATVYFIPEIPTRFGYREKIYLMAKTFGYDTETIKHRLDDKIATFEGDGTKLTIDIGNFNFKYSNDIIETESLVTGSITMSKTNTINKAIDFLKNTGRYPDELSRGTTNLIYLKYDPTHGDFVNVQRASEASAVEVDFYGPTVQGLSITTPKFFNSHNYVIMNFKDGEPNVIRAQIAFFEKSEEQIGVYPLKTGEEAWMKLKAGQGRIVAGKAGTKAITIKKMFTAYLDPSVYQTYFQPVYVFLGDDDFVAYVTAVKDEYLLDQ
jgi:hypothetical protein